MAIYAGPQGLPVTLTLNADNTISFTFRKFTGLVDQYKIYVDNSLQTTVTTNSVSGISITNGANRILKIEAWYNNAISSIITRNVRLFEYTGAEESWTVPTGYKWVGCDVQGAQGGGSGGKGARIRTYITVADYSTLYIRCGGAGGNGSYNNCVGVAPAIVSGGWNGGGDGGTWYDAYGCISPNVTYGRGSSGGGASDIRSVTNNLFSRLVVAGGGGGNGGGTYTGDGGAYDGVDGGFNINGSWQNTIRGKGATILAGGSGGTGGAQTQGTSGTLGQGGNGGVLGVFGDNPGSGAGGGGGYYGGGGGSAGSNYGSSGGGGGGSSYILPPFDNVSLMYGARTSGFRTGAGKILLDW